MEGWLRACLVSLFVCLGAQNLQAADEKPTEVTWSDLRRLNLTSKLVPPALQKLVGTKIKIGGYAVPVETQSKTMEFLFVPDALACIHVPPPPPNLMIHVFALKELLMTEITSGPVWVEGELGPFNLKSQYGEPAVTIIDGRVTPYKK